MQFASDVPICFAGCAMTKTVASPPATFHEIADYFIYESNQTGSLISNLKLQKLVYYAQAWHLALFNGPLFRGTFQAWVHGPVLPELYQRFKVFGWKPIIEDVDQPQLPAAISEFLAQITEAYMPYEALALEQMTHAELPWQQARAGLPPEAASTAPLDETLMKSFYKKRLPRNG